MKQFFYSLKTSALLRKIMFFDFSEILNKYYKYCEGTLSDDEFSAFKSENGVIDIYYKNFHVYIVDNDRDKIVSINLKTEEDEWILNKDDYSNPVTKTFEIYRWYNVTVYGEDRHSNQHYVEGTWNEYFYKTLKALNQTINNMTDKNKMLAEYSHKTFKSSLN